LFIILFSSFTSFHLLAPLSTPHRSKLALKTQQSPAVFVLSPYKQIQQNIGNPVYWQPVKNPVD
jgi:hypothetical protein